MTTLSICFRQNYIDNEIGLLLSILILGEGGTFIHRLVLKMSSKKGRLWNLVQFLRNVPGGIKKNVAMLLSIALALYLILKIEAVSSLIRNMGLWAVIPFGIALLPLFLSKVIIWSKYAKKHIVPSWDVGGIPHRS